jgi:hypothetical protein
MTGRVDDIGFIIFIPDRRILGVDGDAPFALQVHIIHNPGFYELVFPKDAALFQHSVYQGCFTVIYVGDNGDISEFIFSHFYLISFLKNNEPKMYGIGRNYPMGLL